MIRITWRFIVAYFWWTFQSLGSGGRCPRWMFCRDIFSAQILGRDLCGLVSGEVAGTTILDIHYNKSVRGN